MTSWLLPHFVRRAFGDLGAVIQYRDPIRNIHHHTHVVFDQGDGGAELVVDVEHEAAHVLLFFYVHARHRFVQQQQIRFRRQRPAQFDPLLQAIGQAPHRHLADRLDFEKTDDSLDEFAVTCFFAPGPAVIERGLEKVGANLQIPAGHDVVEGGHAAEQGHILEGAGDTLAGRHVRLHLLAHFALVNDFAFLGVIEAVDDVQHRRLAGAVGADDGVNLAFLNIQRDIDNGTHGAERQADVAAFKQDFAGPGGLAFRVCRLKRYVHRHIPDVVSITRPVSSPGACRSRPPPFRRCGYSRSPAWCPYGHPRR